MLYYLHMLVNASQIFLAFVQIFVRFDHSGDLGLLPVELETLVQELNVVRPVVLEYRLVEVPRSL